MKTAVGVLFGVVMVASCSSTGGVSVSGPVTVAARSAPSTSTNNSSSPPSTLIEPPTVKAPPPPDPGQTPVGSAVPLPSISVPEITLVKTPLVGDNFYHAGIPIKIVWGSIGYSIETLAECSLRTEGCDARSRFMPGVFMATGSPVTLTPADLNGRVSVRIERVADGTIVLDLVEQKGNPTFQSPSEGGDYLVGIDLVGDARTLSYVLYVRLQPQPQVPGGAPMTFPVNQAPLPANP
jgi:hypothetical protein